MTDSAAHRSGRAVRALAHMPEVDPGLASLAIWCQLRDGPSETTFTSGDCIFVGSGFQSMALHEQIGVLGHHILHVALRHEMSAQNLRDRLGDHFDLNSYNLLADALVNQCLLDGGHALPRPAVSLKDMAKEGLLDVEGTGAGSLDMWDLDRHYYKTVARVAPDGAALADYGAKTSFAPDLHLDAPDPDAVKKSADWHAHLIRACSIGGGAGRGIGRLLAHLVTFSAQSTPWEHHLRGLLAKSLNRRPMQSYRRPRSNWIAREAEACRMGLPRPCFEPSVRHFGQRPRLAVGLDTSGSVDAATMSLFASEIVGIAQRTQLEVHVLYFDETVYDQTVMKEFDPHAVFRNLSVQRDGGTSFVDVIAQSQRLDPSAIVVLTDLRGQFGPAPAQRVIWASYEAITQRPPFGACLELIR